MQRVRAFFLATVFGIAAIITGLHAEEQPSAELIAKGRELFNNKEGLGVKYACISCHKQEKAIKRDKVKKLGDKLPDVINKHLLDKSKGAKPLAKDSEEMKALEAYILHEHSI